MISSSELQIGDIVGHPSWSPHKYECTQVNSTRFYLWMNGEETSFPYYSEFFISQKRKSKRKSGFGKWIKQYG